MLITNVGSNKALTSQLIQDKNIVDISANAELTKSQRMDRYSGEVLNNS